MFDLQTHTSRITKMMNSLVSVVADLGGKISRIFQPKIDATSDIHTKIVHDNVSHKRRRLSLEDHVIGSAGRLDSSTSRSGAKLRLSLPGAFPQVDQPSVHELRPQDGADPMDLDGPGTFETQEPHAPASYESQQFEQPSDPEYSLKLRALRRNRTSQRQLQLARDRALAGDKDLSESKNLQALTSKLGRFSAARLSSWHSPLSDSIPTDIIRPSHTKTALLGAKYGTVDIGVLSRNEDGSKHYPDRKPLQALGDSDINLGTKTPPRAGKNSRLRGILRNARRHSSKHSPERLRKSRLTKAVRFSDSGVATKAETHIGLDIQKLSQPELDRWAEGALSPQDVDLLEEKSEPSSPETASRLLNRWDNTISSGGFVSIFHKQPDQWRPSTVKREKSVAELEKGIKDLLSEPSPALFQVSRDTESAIELKKQKAAEEARRAAEEKARRALEERLAKSGGLRLPEQPLVSIVDAAWTLRAQETLRAAASTTLATTVEGIELRQHDFAKVVHPTAWLNDEIVNGSLAWLDQAINSAAGIKDVKKATRKCWAAGSFFFKRLREQGVEKTQRTLRRNGIEKSNFLDVETILMPICEHSHWTLLVVRPRKRTVSHMDSLNPRGSPTYTKLALAWIKDILEDKFVEKEWKVMLHEAPLQTNGYDCGVHTITNAMCIALGLSPIDSYVATDMPQQRIRIASMLLNGGFKGDFALQVY